MPSYNYHLQLFIVIVIAAATNFRDQDKALMPLLYGNKIISNKPSSLTNDHGDIGVQN